VNFLLSSDGDNCYVASRQVGATPVSSRVQLLAVTCVGEEMLAWVSRVGASNNYQLFLEQY